jgi:hypothetical protein
LEFPTDTHSIPETNLVGIQSKTGDQLPYPLYAGPVISETIYRYSLKLPIDPWIWWISQFVTHAMRLNDSTRMQIEKDQDRIVSSLMIA